MLNRPFWCIIKSKSGKHASLRQKFPSSSQCSFLSFRPQFQSHSPLHAPFCPHHLWTPDQPLAKCPCYTPVLLMVHPSLAEVVLPRAGSLPSLQRCQGPFTLAPVLLPDCALLPYYPGTSSSSREFVWMAHSDSTHVVTWGYLTVHKAICSLGPSILLSHLLLTPWVALPSLSTHPS